MTDNEANKIIAAFMGHDILECYDPNFGFYTASLNALIPVWKKLESFSIFEIKLSKKTCSLHNLNRGERYIELFNSRTLQQSAAHATAKAIKGLS